MPGAHVVAHDVPVLAERVVPAGVLLLEPGALLGAGSGHGVPPHRGAPEVDADVVRVVHPVHLVEQLVPVPGLLEPEVAELVDELLVDELLHELLEGVRAVLDGRVVVHRQTGEEREQLPRAPEHLVEQVLRDVGLARLHEHLDGGLALLRVTRLVGLDRRDEGAEVEVAHLHRVGRHAQPQGAFQMTTRNLDRRRHRVVRGEHVVEDVARGDDAPLVRVVRLVRPVEAGLLVQRLVREVRLQLAVPHLVEGAVGGHVPPRGRAAEAGHARLADARLVLGDGDGAVVGEDRGLPARVEVVEDGRPAHHVVDREQALVLAGLVVHVLGVGDLVGLVPFEPALC